MGSLSLRSNASDFRWCSRLAEMGAVMNRLLRRLHMDWWDVGLIVIGLFFAVMCFVNWESWFR